MAAKKKEEPVSIQRMTAAELVRHTQQKFGKHAACLGNSEHLKTVHVPTDSIGLNIATDGGFPRGRPIIITGYEGCCKSSVCYTIIAEYQRRFGLPCAILDGDKSAADRMEAFGVDPSMIQFSFPEDLEEALNITYKLMVEGGIEIGDEDNKRKVELGLILIDPVAVLPARKEIVEDKKVSTMEISDVSLRAKLMTKFYRLHSSSIAACIKRGVVPPTLLIVQQYYTGGITTGRIIKEIPGGRAQKYASFLTVEFSKATAEEVNYTPPAKPWEITDTVEEFGEDKKRRVGLKIAYTINKSKVSMDGKHGVFSILTRSTMDELCPPGISKIDEIIRYGLKLKLIEQNGAWFTYADIKAQGMTGFVILLIQRQELMDELERKIYEAAGITNVGKKEE